MSGKVRNTLALFGFDPWRTVQTIRGLPWLMRTMRAYNRANDTGKFPARWSLAYPVFEDREADAGVASGDYFHQDLWAARMIFQRRPTRHLDVGSQINGFVAHVLTFMPIMVVDVRPLHSRVDGLTFIQEDATTMARFPDNSVESLSSLHAVEHFGLGRYGDPINPRGSFEAMSSFARVLARDGHLYFAVPIGRECVRFNGHRIFSPLTVIECFRGLRLVSFSAVDERGDLVSPARPQDFVDVRQALGLFEFTKDGIADPLGQLDIAQSVLTNSRGYDRRETREQGTPCEHPR